MKLSSAIGLATAGLIAPIAALGLGFNIQYLDVDNATGAGFDDPLFGADRRATVDAVANYLDTVLDEPGTVDLVVNQSQSDGSGPLGTGGTFFNTASNGFSNGFGYEHADTGSDPFIGVADINATFDFGYNYSLGTTAPGAGEIDFYSVVLHELTHAMGFLSLLNADGTSTITGGDPGIYSIYDSFLARGDGSPIFAAGGDFTGDPSDLVGDDLFFTGSNAVAANGGQAVKVIATAPFQPGTSIGHVDGSLFPSAVMQPSIMAGQTRREFSDIDLAILQDLGYAVASNTVSVPLPSTLLLMFAIFALCRNRFGAR